MERHQLKASSRRKACDFCYHKKIKCDSLKPQCSPCKLYNADCTYIAKTRQNVAKQSSATSRIDFLEERLRSVEEQLRSFNGAAGDGGGDGSDGGAPGAPPLLPSQPAVHPLASPPSPEMVMVEDNNIGIAISPTPTEDGVPNQQPLGVLESLGHPCPGCVECISPPAGLARRGTVSESYNPDRLPPLHETRPLIEKYFTSGNTAIPIFHAPSFFRLLGQFYSVPASRTRVSWALINTVLAMSQRPFGNYKAACPYIRNAQSVLDQLVVCGSDDLAALQVTLGLASVFYGCPDVVSSCGVLVSIAVRLVQRLRLYTKAQPPPPRAADISDTMPEAEALERTRLFWITYIMDHDISAKTRHPPLLRDEDIDVDLPALDPADGGGGVIVSMDGSARFNLFRSRIQLAWVQGKAYDWLCSARASRATPAQREAVVQKLERVLLDWKSGVPRPFLPENVAAETEPDVLRHFIMLHWEHFFCLALIRGAHIHNQPWLLRLAGGTSSMVSSYFNEISKTDITTDSRERSQALGWDNLVKGTRTCMRLVDSSDPDDVHLMWTITCGYFSGACILMAHLLENPLDPVAQEDLSLLDTSSEKLNKIVGQSRLRKVIHFQKVFNEISGRVKELMSRIAPQIASPEGSDGSGDGDQMFPSVWPEISDFEFTYADMDQIAMELNWNALPGS